MPQYVHFRVQFSQRGLFIVLVFQGDHQAQYGIHGLPDFTGQRCPLILWKIFQRNISVLDNFIHLIFHAEVFCFGIISYAVQLLFPWGLRRCVLLLHFLFLFTVLKKCGTCYRKPTQFISLPFAVRHKRNGNQCPQRRANGGSADRQRTPRRWKRS